MSEKICEFCEILGNVATIDDCKRRGKVVKLPLVNATSIVMKGYGDWNVDEGHKHNHHTNLLTKVVVLNDIPKFVGIDGLNYGEFKEGDITSLPETNAKSLISRGAARSLLSTDCKNDSVGL